MENKILVYDCSMYGQAVCNFLERKLPIRTERIVDEADLQEMSDREILWRVAKKLRPYVGKVPGIVIASPLVVTVVGEELEKIFPRQKFIYLGKDIPSDVGRAEKIGVFVSDRIRRTERYQMMKAACQDAWIDEFNCDKWLRLMEQGWWGQEKIAKELRHKLGVKVILYDQALLLREKQVEEVVDWRGELVDMKSEIIRPLKKVMGWRR